MRVEHDDADRAVGPVEKLGPQGIAGALVEQGSPRGVKIHTTCTRLPNPRPKADPNNPQQTVTLS